MRHTLPSLALLLALHIIPGATWHRAAAQTPSACCYDCYSVDRAPAFPGGDRALLSFINTTRRYPPDALARGSEGRVMCSFIVKADGALDQINVVRGVDEDLDREAVRIISRMPRWQAGQRGGESVDVYYMLSIPFKIY